MKIINIVCSGDFHAKIDLNIMNSLNNPLFAYSRKNIMEDIFILHVEKQRYTQVENT